MSCRRLTDRNEFQEHLEALNPDSAAAIRRVVAAQIAAKQGALHPSTPEEAEQAAQVTLS